MTTLLVPYISYKNIFHHEIFTLYWYFFCSSFLICDFSRSDWGCVRFPWSRLSRLLIVASSCLLRCRPKKGRFIRWTEVLKRAQVTTQIFLWLSLIPGCRPQKRCHNKPSQDGGQKFRKCSGFSNPSDVQLRRNVYCVEGNIRKNIWKQNCLFGTNMKMVSKGEPGNRGWSRDNSESSGS